MKKMTSQPKQKLPPRQRGSRRKLAGSEMKRGPSRRYKILQNKPRGQKVGAGPVKKMTSQPKLKLPPRIRGNKRKFAGSEMKRGPAEKSVTGIFSF